MTKFLHRLGFHGRNWEPFWFKGNVWVECVICGAREMIPFEDVNEIPLEAIAPKSRFD